MSRVSAGNKPFKGIEPTLTETENDMANENKTQGFEYGAIAASLGMKDGEVKDVMARISELKRDGTQIQRNTEITERRADRHRRKRRLHPELADRPEPQRRHAFPPTSRKRRTSRLPVSRHWWRMPLQKARLTVRRKRSGWRW
ncbi:hypothetical protein NXV13_10450 [Bacteroides ovatus]|nr:hypothetical protein [Bacteroides ovatus]